MDYDQFPLSMFEVDCDGSSCGSGDVGLHVHPQNPRRPALARVVVRGGVRISYAEAASRTGADGEPPFRGGAMEQLHKALSDQSAHIEQSKRIDRTDWTRKRWLDDARAQMHHPDGSVRDLVNGHPLAMLEEIDALRGELVKVRQRLASVLDEFDLERYNGVSTGEWTGSLADGEMTAAREALVEG